MSICNYDVVACFPQTPVRKRIKPMPMYYLHIDTHCVHERGCTLFLDKETHAPIGVFTTSEKALRIVRQNDPLAQRCQECAGQQGVGEPQGY